MTLRELQEMNDEEYLKYLKNKEMAEVERIETAQAYVDAVAAKEEALKSYDAETAKQLDDLRLERESSRNLTGVKT